MKTLEDSDDRRHINAVRKKVVKTEEGDGYFVDYYKFSASARVEEQEGELAVVITRKRGKHETGEVVRTKPCERTFRVGEEDEAMKYCYEQLLEYFREHTGLDDNGCLCHLNKHYRESVFGISADFLGIGG